MSETKSKYKPNLEEIHDKEISPLMEKIIEICKEHKIPMVACFNYGPNEHCSTVMIGDEYPEDRLLRELANRIHLARRGFAAFMITVTPTRSKDN